MGWRMEDGGWRRMDDGETKEARVVRGRMTRINDGKIAKWWGSERLPYI